MYTKLQRAMAWIGIGLLLLLYIVSFWLGIFGSKRAFPMFMASLLATFFIPTMMYLFQLILRNAKERRVTGEEELQQDAGTESGGKEEVHEYAGGAGHTGDHESR